MTSILDASVTHPLWRGVGIYPADELSLADYHLDIVPGGSLSSSGARALMAPGCPQKYRYEQDHGQPPKKAFDYGNAAHSVVLGAGPELVVVDAPRWDTTILKSKVSEVRARGAIPLKRHEYDQIMAMADALRRHPEAGPLLDPDSGTPEQSLFWTDRETGVTCRARIDWWRHDGEPVDYKSARSAEPEKLERDFAEYGYHQQDDWYCTGLQTLGYGNQHTALRFVVQEKEPPYVVTVVRLDPEARRIGQILNQAALHLYATCTATGHWPGYSEDTEVLSLPPYIANQYH